MDASELYANELSKASSLLSNGGIKLSYKHLESALEHLKSIPTIDTNINLTEEPSKMEDSIQSKELPPVLSSAEQIDGTGSKSIPQSSASASSSIYPSPPSLTAYSGKIGRSSHTSPFNPSTPILPNSQVAYKPKLQPDADWILCRVLRVVSEVKFEIQDPEPDDLNPNGAIFKASAKEVILIPLQTAKSKPLKQYKPGMRVLAKYPETTVFYPAEVVDCGPLICKLIFEGEEEEDKITSVERPFVLPT